MANTSMTAKELQAWLKTRFPKEDQRHEWKEWRSLKSNVSGRKGEDLVSYVSALSNMEGDCIVIGVQEKTLVVTGIQDFTDYTPENIVNRVLGKTPGLPSAGLHIEVLQATDTEGIVWLVHVPRHSPRQPVLAHDKAWQRDGDSLMELRPDRLHGTDTRTDYTRNKGLDDYYKTLILQHIRQFKSVSLAEVRSLLLDKLPNSLTQEQKLIKLKNLLATLRTTGLDGTKIVATGAGRTTRWVICTEEFIG